MSAEIAPVDPTEEPDAPKHGGARPGAGRPLGGVSSRTAKLRDEIAALGVDPVVALARIGRDAEAREDWPVATECYKAIAPFLHPRPKPVEVDPDGLVDLERRLLQAKIEATADALESPGLAERLARAKQRAQVTIIMDTGISRAPDDVLIDVTPAPAPEARHGAPAPSAGPEPAQTRDAASAPAPEPYRPILPREAPPPTAADWSAPPAPWPERPARAATEYNPFETEPYTGGLLGSRNT